VQQCTVRLALALDCVVLAWQQVGMAERVFSRGVVLAEAAGDELDRRVAHTSRGPSHTSLGPTHQHGAARLVHALDLLHHRAPLAALGPAHTKEEGGIQ